MEQRMDGYDIKWLTRLLCDNVVQSCEICATERSIPSSLLIQTQVDGRDVFIFGVNSILLANIETRN